MKNYYYYKHYYYHLNLLLLQVVLVLYSIIDYMVTVNAAFVFVSSNTVQVEHNSNQLNFYQNYDYQNNHQHYQRFYTKRLILSYYYHPPKKRQRQHHRLSTTRFITQQQQQQQQQPNYFPSMIVQQHNENEHHHQQQQQQHLPIVDAFDSSFMINNIIAVNTNNENDVKNTLQYKCDPVSESIIQPNTTCTGFTAPVSSSTSPLSSISKILSSNIPCINTKSNNNNNNIDLSSFGQLWNITLNKVANATDNTNNNDAVLYERRIRLHHYNDPDKNNIHPVLSSDASTTSTASTIQKFLTIHRFKVWWMRPTFVSIPKTQTTTTTKTTSSTGSSINNNAFSNSASNNHMKNTIRPETIMLLTRYAIINATTTPNKNNKQNETEKSKAEEETEESTGTSSSSTNTNKEKESFLYRLILAVPLPVVERNKSKSAHTTDSEGQQQQQQQQHFTNSNVTFTTSSLRGATVQEEQKRKESTMLQEHHHHLDDMSTVNIILSSNYHYTGLYVGQGYDPYQLIQHGVTTASSVWDDKDNNDFDNGVDFDFNDTIDEQSIGKTNTSFSSRCEDTHRITPKIQSIPPFCTNDSISILNTLGWCTWNAFYTNVSGTGIINAAYNLKVQQKVPICWIIIDDGYQSICNPKIKSSSLSLSSVRQQISNATIKGQEEIKNIDTGEQWSCRLVSFQEDTIKFQNLSLQETIQVLKKPIEYNGTIGIDFVFLWHTLVGYWLGIDCSNNNDAISVDARTATSSTTSLTNTVNMDNVIDEQCTTTDDCNQIVPKLPLAQILYPQFPIGIQQNDPSCLQESSIQYGIGIPNDATEFYNQYHTKWMKQLLNVDGVKVDAQAVIGTLKDVVPSTTTTTTTKLAANILSLQSALSNSIRENFQNNKVSNTTTDTDFVENNKDEGSNNSNNAVAVAPVIYSMAHSPEIFFRLPSLYSNKQTYKGKIGQKSSSSRSSSSSSNSSTSNSRKRNGLPLLRVADDYYPNNDSSHGTHVIACAFNSLLFQHVSIPDWDMFTTTHTNNDNIQRLHAISRCISGGPIYLSDDALTTNSNQTVLEWITCSNGITLPCQGTAVPVIDSLFHDPLYIDSADTHGSNENELFVIWNTNGESITSAIFGVFNVLHSGDWDYSVLDYIPNGDNRKDIYSIDLQPRTVWIKLSDIPYLVQQYNNIDCKFLVIHFFSNTVQVLESYQSSFKVQLLQMESESITILPIIPYKLQSCYYEIVHIGFITMINGAGAVQNIMVQERYNDDDDKNCHRQLLHTICCAGTGRYIICIRRSKPNNAVAVAGVDDFITTYSNKKILVTICINNNIIQYDEYNQYDNSKDTKFNTESINNNSNQLMVNEKIHKLILLGFTVISFDVPSSSSSQQNKSSCIIHIRIDDEG